MECKVEEKRGVVKEVGGMKMMDETGKKEERKETKRMKRRKERTQVAVKRKLKARW